MHNMLVQQTALEKRQVTMIVEFNDLLNIEVCVSSPLEVKFASIQSSTKCPSAIKHYKDPQIGHLMSVWLCILRILRNGAELIFWRRKSRGVKRSQAMSLCRKHRLPKSPFQQTLACYLHKNYDFPLITHSTFGCILWF